jgi:hypothetical protein
VEELLEKKHATIEELLEVVFSMWFALWLYTRQWLAVDIESESAGSHS